MNNGNMPAMPLTGDAYQDFAAYDGTKNTSYNPECQGLTKREYFAAMAMQGILTSSLEVPQDVNNNERFCEWIAESAKLYADALLKALEANNE